MAEQATITITIDPIEPANAERVKNIIERMVVAGAFAVSNGSAELHFDHEGQLKAIHVHESRWRATTAKRKSE